MGVLGFTPFLQKACPKVIKQIPTRLRALTGKTIAIDGNLVTQRFHFGAVSHDHRHVIGWYKIIHDLRANGVGVITVWDGKKRSSAKAREEARRKAARLLQLARGTHELGRLRRLERLTAAVKKYQQLDRPEQLQVTRAVRAAVGAAAEAQLLGLADVMDKVQSSKGVEVVGDDAAVPEEDVAEERADRAMRRAVLLKLYAPEEREALEGFLDHYDADDMTVVSVVDDAYEAALAAMVDSPEPEDVRTGGHFLDLPLEDAAPYYPSHPPSEVGVEPTLSLAASAVSEEFIELYQDFQKSTVVQKAEFEAVPTKPESLPPSKWQAKLTQDEELFWKRLTAEVSEPEPEGPEAEEAIVEGLLDRSGEISSRYEKRNRRPTAATYTESRRILGAMGVPCIEAEYPYEAEAVAASLVIHGYADYVGSEDTDVLVYEAPLLRNLTNRNLPLALISGTEVRNALELTRPSFLDLALLLGTDFTQRVKNLGPHTAIKLIREYGSIERMLEGQTKYAPETRAAYMEQVEVARLIFSTLPPVPDVALLQPTVYDDNDVHAILKEYGIGVPDLAENLVEHGTHSADLGVNYFGDDPMDPTGACSVWNTATL